MNKEGSFKIGREGSFKLNKSIDRQTSFTRKSILKNSGGDSERDETDHLNYTPKHFELNRDSSSAGLLKERHD